MRHDELWLFGLAQGAQPREFGEVIPDIVFMLFKGIAERTRYSIITLYIQGFFEAFIEQGAVREQKILARQDRVL